MSIYLKIIKISFIFDDVQFKCFLNTIELKALSLINVAIQYKQPARIGSKLCLSHLDWFENILEDKVIHYSLYHDDWYVQSIICFFEVFFFSFFTFFILNFTHWIMYSLVFFSILKKKNVPTIEQFNHYYHHH